VHRAIPQAECCWLRWRNGTLPYRWIPCCRKSTRQRMPRPTSKRAAFGSPLTNVRPPSPWRPDARPRLADLHGAPPGWIDFRAETRSEGVSSCPLPYARCSSRSNEKERTRVTVVSSGSDLSGAEVVPGRAIAASLPDPPRPNSTKPGRMAGLRRVCDGRRLAQRRHLPVAVAGRSRGLLLRRGLLRHAPA
jgi:hypothetical protein